MKKATINLYEFHELNETAKRTAIEDHRNFMLSTMEADDFISGDPEYDTPEKLEETYNSEYEYINENDEPVIESIEANEYLFFYDGTFARVFWDAYTEKFSTIKIGGEMYKIFEKRY